MNQELGLQTWPAPRPLRVATGAVVPVLIRVPVLDESPRGQGWRKVQARRRSAVGAGKRRRRLRREVRVAAYGLLLMAMLAWAAPGWHALGPRLLPALDRLGAIPRGHGPGAAGVAGFRPSISISIEPAALAPYADAESPVVFPGYLLPDDGREEPAHAGS